MSSRIWMVLILLLALWPARGLRAQDDGAEPAGEPPAGPTAGPTAEPPAAPPPTATEGLSEEELKELEGKVD